MSVKNFIEFSIRKAEKKRALDILGANCNEEPRRPFPKTSQGQETREGEGEESSEEGGVQEARNEKGGRSGREESRNPFRFQD